MSPLVFLLWACETPEPVFAVISPQEPTAVDRLSVDVTDPSDSVVRLEWFVDERSRGLTGPEVSAQETRSNTVWQVRAYNIDNQAVATDQVVIWNTPPGELVAEIRPARVWQGSRFRCGVAEPAPDVDDDALDYQTQWFRDGAPYDGAVIHDHYAGDTLPAGVAQAGETWACELTADDGAAQGPSAQASVTIEASPGGNVLLVLIDDAGIDKIAAYDAHPSPAKTPNIDGLADEGVLFRNAYARPVCSPARAALLTGRHGRRYGMGTIVRVDSSTFELPVEERMLAEVVGDSPVFDYTSAAAGKWHLAGFQSPSTWLHPVYAGWDWYGGSMGNLANPSVSDGQTFGYYHWEKNVNGEVFTTEVYATTDTIDDAIHQIQTLPEPWLVYVAFNAPHVPEHVPPAALVTEFVDEDSASVDLFEAALEAADTELGRLLDALEPSLRPRTTLVLMGDNGTPGDQVRAPWNPEHAKDTLYEGGVKVPLFVTGPLLGQIGVTSTALVDITDVFATVATITGGQQSADVDGVSFLSVLADASAPGGRERVILDRFRPNGPPPYTLDEWMVRDDRYKLIQFSDGSEALYDLLDLDVEGDALDLEQLTEAQSRRYQQLAEALTQERRTRVYAAP